MIRIENTTNWDHEVETEHASAKFENVRFNGTLFRRVLATNLEFTDCDFRNVHLGMQSQWTDCVWRNCNFTGRYSTMGGPAVFRRCQFLDGQIDFVDFGNAEFVDCVFTGELMNSVFRGDSNGGLAERGWTTVFKNVDMSGLHLEHVYFRRKFDLSSSVLPSSGITVLHNENGKCVQALRAAEAAAGDARSGIRVYAQDLYLEQDPLPICDSTIEMYFRTAAGREEFLEIIEPFK